MIYEAGYPAETHTVVTEDGYILRMHRIPHGKHVTNRYTVPLECLWCLYYTAYTPCHRKEEKGWETGKRKGKGKWDKKHERERETGKGIGKGKGDRTLYYTIPLSAPWARCSCSTAC